MRVLHLGKFFPPFAGGMEYFLADLLPALRDQDIQVAALVHDHRKHRLAQHPTSDGDEPKVYRVPCYGRLLYAPISPSFPLWLTRILRDWKPDLLHLHLPNTSAFWALLIPAARRVPWVIHWHSDVVPSRLDRRLALAYGLYRPWENRLLAGSSAIIATSPPYCASSPSLQSWKEKCHIIPLGLNAERIAEPQADIRHSVERWWGEQSLRLLTVGRLTYYKGHEVLIQAVAAVPEARLLIVGEGQYRPRLEALIRCLGLEGRVRLMGLRSEAELYALFASCDVFCLPSLERTEAFGLVLLEAMRFEKPVVASDIVGSGVGWVVQQAGHGLLVKPGDVEGLAAALMELKAAPQQRQRLGRLGRRSLSRDFHIRAIAEQTMALYRQL